MKNKIEIPITQPATDFQKHLEIDGNDRIIFSAKFGNGKTYFLKKFFEENPNYDVIHLFPIKYTVASNEDIFELIKYDVLFNLLGKDVNFNKIEIPHINTIISFAGKNSHELLAPFIKLIPNLGNSFYSIYEKLYGLYKDYLKKHESAQVDEYKNAVDYLQGFTGTKGNIYEEDFFTLLIKDLVGQLKKDIGDTGKKKKTVLIIDDLDRIDPDHIFRILNVLSAHFDLEGDGNKFDFDKIILVCDIENVRRIFTNRFGAGVDFTGYIDKFYSKEVFQFDNKEIVVDHVDKIIKSITLSKHMKDFKLLIPNTIINNNLVYILSGFIYYNAVNIRTLLKLENRIFAIKSYEPKLQFRPRRYSNHSFEILLIIDFLLEVFSDIDQIIEACEKCRIFTTKRFKPYEKSAFPAFIFPLLDMEKHQFKYDRENDGNNVHEYKLGNVIIKYVARDFSFGWAETYQCNIHSITENGNTNDPEIDYDYFALLKALLVKIRNEGIIPENFNAVFD